MNKASKIVSFLLFFCITHVDAQDMHFTQFYSSPLYLNPAFTGSAVCGRVAATYRNQWPGISKTYKSYLFSADHYIKKYNLGVGLLFANDEAGTGQLKTTLIYPSVAYEVQLNRKTVARLAVQPGMGMKSINYNKLIFGDQIARGGDVATLETPAMTKTFFDIGAGALIHNAKYWIGTSFFHLNKPNESLTGLAKSTLPIKYTVQGGAKFTLHTQKKEDFFKKSFTTAFHYRGQKEFDQFDVGVYYTQYVFNLGFWYRGIPGLKAYKKGYSNNDAVSVIVGMALGRMNIGYSYDMTISKLYAVTHGAHEVCVSYQICNINRKKKYRLLIPCPKF